MVRAERRSFMNPIFRHLRYFVPLLFIAVTVSACSSGWDEAERGVTEFRSRYAARQFLEIFRESAPELKNVTPEAEFIPFLEAISRKLGKFESSTDAGWRIFAGASGKRVVIL